ncbi:BON domain-containing protein [Acidobacteria bacterium AB60]|nr:BON domain-containing protein [Acidobacteria bacterium AB60]
MKKTASLLIVISSFCLNPILQSQALLRSAHATQAGQQQDVSNDLSVVAGRSVLLDCAQPVQRVAVGTAGVAEATVVSPTEILVNGKAAGETSLILWEKGGSREFFNVTVRASQSSAADGLDSVRRELKREFPDQAIRVAGENGSLFLSGTVKDLNSADRAVKIASIAGKVVNLLNVEVPEAQPQILLKVVFASVDRTKTKELGLNPFSTGFGNVDGSLSTGQFPAPLNSPVGLLNFPNDLNIFGFLPGMNLGATLKALESKGLVEVLAEPNVLAENGKVGSFLAGGEYPYPIVQASTTGTAITIMFKEYGVRLNFIPTITPRGSIHLQVAPEVSSLDFTNAVTIDGYQIPAISIRKVKSEVELSEGQSFAIGGLLDNRETQTFQKLPFISSVPILGKLFQSISRTRTNTELIVIVTPEIVQPIPAGTAPPALHYPEPFLESNSNIPMHTPDQNRVPAKPAPATMPVEKLVESMKPEKPLVTDEATGYTGSSSMSAAPSSSAPQ